MTTITPIPCNGIRIRVLGKLLRKHFIGGRHTSLEAIKKSFDKNDYPKVEDEVALLIRHSGGGAELKKAC